MSRPRFHSSFASLSLGIGFVAACSVVNSFDEVKQQPDGTAGSAAGSSGSSSKAGESPTAGGAPGDNGGAPPVMQGGSAGEGVIEPPMTGLVVLGGSTVADGEVGEGVLAVLDPTTGALLTSETIAGAAVVAMGYDGRTNLWYFFTSSSFPADPNSKADLQVRSYDDATNEWTVISKVTALPPPQPNGLIVMNDRLAYLSYKVDSGIQNAVTLLDTSDPNKVTPVAYSEPDLPGQAVGIVGSRGAPGDDSVLGGTVAVALAEGCTGTEAQRSCKSLSLLPIFVGDQVSNGLAVDFGTFGGIPGFASARGQQRAFMALPPAVAGGNVKVFSFDPRTPSADESQLAPTAARWIGGVSYAECESVAVISTVDAGRLLALTSAGLAANIDLGRSGQGVEYEPFTHRLVLPFNPDSDLFDAPALGAGGAGGAASEPSVDGVEPKRNGANISLAKLDEVAWSAPTDINVDVMATRFPTSFACPE
jgi:hypothetical protein